MGNEPQIQFVDVKELQLLENNPRTISKERFEELKRSITDDEDYFWVRPILVNNQSGQNVVYGGNQRLKAAKALGMEKVPCIIQSLTKEQERSRVIKDNAKFGDWDYDIVANAWQEEFEDWAGDVGFGETKEKEGMEDDDAVPDIPKAPKSKLGDLYQLGGHFVLCGDATNVDDVERLMGGEKADLYNCDPPYNVDYTGKTKDALKIQNDKKGDEEFRQFLRDAFSAVNIVLKPGGVFYVWHADSEGYNVRGACKDNDWVVRQCLIWNKNTMVMGRQDYQWKHEPCLYGWKEGAAHLWNSDRKQTTIMDFNRPQKSAEHPTMKPVELIIYQIKNNSRSADIVLDTFGGSGSTLIACEKTDRKCYMLELDPKYVDTIITRYCQFVGSNKIIKNGEAIEWAK